MKTFEQVVAEQKVAEESQEWRGHTIANIRRVFDSIQDKAHWKNPITVKVTVGVIGIALTAIAFFHADENAQVSGNGDGTFTITSNGYQG